MLSSLGSHRAIRIVVGSILMMSCPGAALAQTDVDDIYQLELEQLMELPVTSVNKRTSSLAKSAAAVYVITNEDIRRSGAVSLPEALSLAPGVDVVRTNASTWGVGVRGFNGQYSNKLLVLIDGRSIYSVIAGSVFWDVAMPLLDDIERIEVIRGPGASLWGSNAVNGVINVITKSAEHTHNQHVVLGAGNEELFYSRARSGGLLENGMHYRLYGQTFNRDSSIDYQTGRDSEDAYQGQQLGVRLDWRLSDSAKMFMQGELYRLDKEYNPLIDDLLANDAPSSGFNEDIYGGHWLTHWSRELDDQEQADIQLSIDKMVRDESLFQSDVLNIDVDLQHTLPIANYHQITWGVSYRFSQDELRGKYFVEIDDQSMRYDRTTAFLQDEISLTDYWALVLGFKLEETEFAATDYQPTLRVLWTPTTAVTGWAAASKANRTPTRVGRGVQLRFGNESSSGLDRYISGNDGFESETLFSYEMGLRSQLLSTVFIDVSGFYSEYEDLRTFDITVDQESADPRDWYVDFSYANRSQGYSYGGELLVEWKPLNNVSINVQYSYFDFDADPEPAFLGEGAGVEVFEQQEVHNIAALRMEYTFEQGVELDWAVKYRDGMELDDVQHHTDLDVRIAWRFSPQLALSLIGKNVTGSKRLEFTDSLLAPRWSQIEPSIALQVDFHF